jgi:hypothetical protein
MPKKIPLCPAIPSGHTDLDPKPREYTIELVTPLLGGGAIAGTK